MIAFVRHGRTSWNAERRLQGRTELPLDDIGREQAANAGRTLAQWRWSGVISSPLLRARQTAELIAAALALPAPGCDDGLIERDYGAAEGVTVQDAAERWPDGEYPGAESALALAARAGSAFDRLLAQDQPLVVVGHGAFLRAGVETVTGRRFPRILNGDVLLASGDPVRFHVFAR